MTSSPHLSSTQTLPRPLSVLFQIHITSLIPHNGFLAIVFPNDVSPSLFEITIIILKLSPHKRDIAYTSSLVWMIFLNDRWYLGI